LTWVKAVLSALAHLDPERMKYVIMNRSIENMMSEHRLIEQVLGALDAMVIQLDGAGDVSREDIVRFATFFREFADRIHHGKEEDRLFAKMNECGFPREYGPVGVMLGEHEAGRAHVRALVEIGAGSGPLTPAEKRVVIEHGSEYVPLLLAHIQKEDNILYPMAQQAIPKAAFEQLDRDCEAFEKAAMSPEKLEELRTLAAELVESYPPDACRLAGAQACVGCAGHHA
jgi:hemerythrin-like domain-containing protein